MLLGIFQRRKTNSKHGFVKQERFNPYNPLTYLTIAIVFVIFLFSEGIKGFSKRSFVTSEDFKWTISYGGEKM